MSLPVRLLELLFVPHCPACDQRAEPPLCPACADTLVELGRACPRCAEPQAGPGPAVVCALVAIAIRRNTIGYVALCFGALGVVGLVLGA